MRFFMNKTVLWALIIIVVLVIAGVAYAMHAHSGMSGDAMMHGTMMH